MCKTVISLHESTLITSIFQDSSLSPLKLTILENPRRKTAGLHHRVQRVPNRRVRLRNHKIIIPFCYGCPSVSPDISPWHSYFNQLLFILLWGLLRLLSNKVTCIPVAYDFEHDVCVSCEINLCVTWNKKGNWNLLYRNANNISNVCFRRSLVYWHVSCLSR